ncbi:MULTISPECIES: hypothetical protein [unclassified Burkholderia]|uniref:hypothetical protein n=1 Tax=unclassified Burkholderia TaxID=2613784 RepID=UPI002AB214EF|nr:MULTISPECIES: hypothetical protein [unclassified Burkholderia]
MHALHSNAMPDSSGAGAGAGETNPLDVSPVVKILLQREGEMLGRWESRSFKSANHVLYTWARQGETYIGGRGGPAPGSYEKVNVVVEWANGLSYAYRHDLHNWSESKEFPDIGAKLRFAVDFYAGRRRPDSWTPERHAAYLQSFGNSERQALMNQIAQTCAFDDAPSSPAESEPADRSVSDGPRAQH